MSYLVSELVILTLINKRSFSLAERFRTLFTQGAGGLDINVFVEINLETKSARVVVKRDQLSFAELIGIRASYSLYKNSPNPSLISV